MKTKNKIECWKWAYGISITILFLLLIFYVLPQLNNKSIDLQKSNCSEIIKYKTECMLDGSFWSESNCENYEIGNYRNSGGRKSNAYIDGYKCTGDIYYSP